MGITISMLCLALIVLRNLFPNIFKMDAVSIGLLIVGVAPWIRSAIKSIEVAGVGKIELNDVEKVAKAIEASDLPTPDDAPDLPEGIQGAEQVEQDQPDVKVASNEGNTWAEPKEANKGSTDSGTPLTIFYTIDGAAPKRIKSGARPADDLVELELRTSLLPGKSSSRVELSGLREILMRSIRYLCQINSIPPLGLSTMGMMHRLMEKSVITTSQAGGIVAAMDMINEVEHTSATPEAMRRTLDLAKEVVESLDVMIRKSEVIRLARTRNSRGLDEKEGEGG
ncbi:hypothetical protein [Stenotrophomonas sp. Ps181]|uniref:hypothetical protein n=1 Tax=Stenotrophomonas sp. Ps181 TaxID=2859892 RepID=UPI0021E13B37|nr:hypothetical protein [Stenotrophomonas sp. Ps181]MCV0218818.1 hypothetical protein [Stenotrophomonas sp. Ps181]